MQQYTALEAEIFNALIALINESMTLYMEAERAMAISQVRHAVHMYGCTHVGGTFRVPLCV